MVLRNFHNEWVLGYEAKETGVYHFIESGKTKQELLLNLGSKIIELQNLPAKEKERTR